MRCLPFIFCFDLYIVVVVVGVLKGVFRDMALSLALLLLNRAMVDG